MVLRPIGFVRHGYSDEEVRARDGGVDGVVEVLPEYAEGLEGLEGFSHIILVAYLHKSRGAPLKVRLRRLARRGYRLEDLPLVGVFASGSPDRPNPIALTIARLRAVRGRILEVGGLDLYDGTPVLDIKPYSPRWCVRDARIPGWLERLLGGP
ncbi:tRNA (N6-threonylcarbamoyladenosine(37)-N6)-methyltransferase TrmO [Stetteria hydrogenophila]